MTSAPVHSRRRSRDARWLALGVVLIGGLIALVHARAFDYGLFMDDWAHYRQLQEADWSLAGLTAACRLELVGGIAEMWWLPETTLRFFRPVAFGLMKGTYALIDWNPQAMHVVSLGWHLGVCTLLLALLRRLGAALWLAIAVAAMFALHPGHVATVQWIACQTELMVTALLLGATLSWGRYRGWPGFVNRRRRGHSAWLVLTLILFALALGCRENAVMFPFVLGLLEWRLKGRRPPGLAWAYAGFALLLVIYVGTRTYYLGGTALPPRPYVIPPTAADFPRFAFDKLCYYLLGEFFLVPCVPIGGLPYFREHPFLFYGLAAAVVALFVFVTLRLVRRRIELLGPIWVIAFFLPLLPAFASPHHLYLPGVGWALMAMLILRAITAARLTAPRMVRRLRLGLAVSGAAFWITASGLVSYYMGLTFQTGQDVERHFFQEIATTPAGLDDGDILYVANMPLIGHYARLGVEAQAGHSNLRVIPLTWSTRILATITPSELRWLDERTIELHIAEEQYFSGALGLLAESATGRPIPDQVDRRADLGFVMEVLDRDASGLRALRFTFERPLTAPGIHLFWGSRARWAFEVNPPGGVHEQRTDEAAASAGR